LKQEVTFKSNKIIIPRNRRRWNGYTFIIQI
jgi:hypothetical protein